MSDPDTPLQDPWRRFLLLLAGTAIGVGLVVFGFVALVDPWNTLPASPRFQRWPVDGDARYAFPALARSAQFDSAIFGTSTSRLLRPATLDPLFGVRFANLAMNSATAFEQSELMGLFIAHHPAAKVLAVGLDLEWCKAAWDMTPHTVFKYPAWMYAPGEWHRYGDIFDLYAVELAGRAFAEFTGLKPRVYGRDGYTRFVPKDQAYDPARAEANLVIAAPWGPSHDLPGTDPARWPMPGPAMLQARLATAPPATLKLLYWVPYNDRLIGRNHDWIEQFQTECKRRFDAVARAIPGTMLVDLMIPSPITSQDSNYWDPLHYRVAIAERLARDLALAALASTSADYVVRVPLR